MATTNQNELLEFNSEGWFKRVYRAFDTALRLEEAADSLADQLTVLRYHATIRSSPVLDQLDTMQDLCAAHRMRASELGRQFLYAFEPVREVSSAEQESFEILAPLQKAIDRLRFARRGLCTTEPNGVAAWKFHLSELLPECRNQLEQFREELTRLAQAAKTFQAISQQTRQVLTARYQYDFLSKPQGVSEITACFNKLNLDDLSDSGSNWPTATDVDEELKQVLKAWSNLLLNIVALRGDESATEPDFDSLELDRAQRHGCPLNGNQLFADLQNNLAKAHELLLAFEKSLQESEAILQRVATPDIPIAFANRMESIHNQWLDSGSSYFNFWSSRNPGLFGGLQENFVLLSFAVSQYKPLAEAGVRVKLTDMDGEQRIDIGKF
jgi:hypothetical protein